MIRRLLNLSEILGGRDNATALVIDTRLPKISDQIDQGFNLTFFSAQSQLEIWLPILTEGANVPLRDSLEASRDASLPKRKSAPRQKGRQSKKKQKPQDPALPLDQEEVPEVDVKFSARDEG